MLETLADAIDGLSSDDRGLYFTSGDLSPGFFSFQQLRDEVTSLARKLIVVSDKRREPVILLLDSQAEFVQVFLAAIRAGLVVVPVYPPSLIADMGEYSARIEHIRQITGARLIFTSEVLKGRLKALLPDASLLTLPEINTVNSAGELPRIHSSDMALIQFTSGSTAAPKGVAITHRNLVANAFAIKQALALDPQKDKGVCWLPLYHDMGLIGFLVTPILTEVSNWYLPPLEFARRPHRWLDLLSQTQATISFAPNFGYDLITRRVRAGDAAKWDLTNWRVAGCGGEAIHPGVLNQFAELLRPAGFDRDAFVASYGLAETTLAVSISPLQRGLVCRNLSDAKQHSRSLVSSGKRVADTTVRIVASDGSPMPDGEEGEIQVRGPGVAMGYLTDSGFDTTLFKDGWLKTGDLGVQSEGELHVCGRIKEVVLLNGRNYYPHDIEDCIQDIDGISKGGAVAFGRPGASSEQLVLAVETKPSVDASALRCKLRKRVRERLELNVADIVILGRNVISRTTSGKLQRQALKARYLSRELCGEAR